MAFTLDQTSPKPQQSTNQSLDFSEMSLGENESVGQMQQAPISKDTHVGSNLENNLTNTENHGLEFLEPKKDINKEAKNDPYRIMVTDKEAYQMTMKTLNALSVVSPIVSGLLQTMEPNQEGKVLSDNFTKIITEVSTVAESTCSKIGVDPLKANNKWVRNMLERIYSNMAHDQWVKNQDVKLEEVYYLIEKVVDFADNAAEKAHYIDLDELSSIKLACVSAMAPIIAEMEDATLYRNISEDIEPIMDKLIKACEEGVARLANDYAGADNRAKLFTLLMQEAGKLYASSWKNEVKRIQSVVSKNANNEKIKKQFEDYKNNGGMPIVNIDKNFDKFFDRIIIITNKLIENRRKKK